LISQNADKERGKTLDESAEQEQLATVFLDEECTGYFEDQPVEGILLFQDRHQLSEQR
jgi:hypothetical protein